MRQRRQPPVQTDDNPNRLAGNKFNFRKIENHQPAIFLIDQFEELFLNRFQLHRVHQRWEPKFDDGCLIHLSKQIFRGHFAKFLDYAKQFDGVWWATREEVAACYLTQHATHIPPQAKPPS